ncbi:hypothetical protein [Kitasatospora sp. NBC_01302]|uniref:hypothetical protein n=1 Tax=Kitasatospora sp. NBC_01302 TaxID=2903575 RepID=UPI002E10605A|nr:hypothetical protein OG294_36745 [Kitasatospora sp. NBC_01302]
MTTTTDVRLFAYRQGPLRTALAELTPGSDTDSTTSTLPPARARGSRGRPLPAGTHRLLADAPYPQPLPADALATLGPGDLAGHLLVCALGLQRREPSHHFNDHRAIASVRSKFPVHAFVLAPDGSRAYLDIYRHALIDLQDDADVSDNADNADNSDGSDNADGGGDLAELLPAPGDLTVVLAARYTDLPVDYGRLRCTLSLLELGINLRALHTAADLLGVPVRLRSDAALTRAAGRLLEYGGPGAWSPPLVVTLEGAGPLPSSRPLPGTDGFGDAEQHARECGLLREQSGQELVREADAVTAPLAALSCGAGEPVRSVPDLAGREPAEHRPAEREPAGQDAGPARPDWARTLWNRSAGRTRAGLLGFSARPAVLGAEFLRDTLAWLDRPAPGPLLPEVGRRVLTRVVLQRTAGLPTGRYAVARGHVECEQQDSDLMRRFADAFGYPLTPAVDCGLRHANAVWVFAADLDGILAEFGPAGWSLLQLWCGWATHGLTTAAAAHGLFARPARSFGEFWLQRTLDLPRSTFPVFTVICGRSRFSEPVLDLRV